MSQTEHENDLPQDSSAPPPETPPETTPEPTPASAPTETDPPTDTAVSADLTDDDKTMAMLAHLLGAFTSIVGPLVVWLIKKDDSAFVNQEGKEAVNFHITSLIAYAALTPIAILTCGVGGLLYPVIALAVLILSILAALKAKDGEPYRYPLTLRLIK